MSIGSWSARAHLMLIKLKLNTTKNGVPFLEEIIDTSTEDRNYSDRIATHVRRRRRRCIWISCWLKSIVVATLSHFFLSLSPSPPSTHHLIELNYHRFLFYCPIWINGQTLYSLQYEPHHYIDNHIAEMSAISMVYN